MNRHARSIVLCLLVFFAGAVPSFAQDTPERGRGAMVERIRKNLAELNLSKEQQEKVDIILADAAEHLIKLREESKGDLDSLRDKAGGVFQDVRQKVQDVLTPEQQRKFQELMPRGQPRRPAERENPSEAKPKPDEMMDSKAEAPKPKLPPIAPKAEPPPLPPVPPDRFAAGTAAPDLRLKNLDGKNIALQNFKGKPTVLIFGSFSSPTFRDRVAAFEAMKKDYRSKINIAIVYTREAYANNEWDVQRNITEQIRVTPHLDIDERTKMAKMTRDGLKISIDVLVDEMDDGVATAYDAMPNGCFILDSAGKIVTRQKWADAFGARNAVDEALKAK